jgi:hypothetical protein
MLAAMPSATKYNHWLRIENLPRLDLTMNTYLDTNQYSRRLHEKVDQAPTKQ